MRERMWVHKDFKRMLMNTLEEINKHTTNRMSMEELTQILSGNNGVSGALSLKMPIIIIPARKSRGRPFKPLWQKYVNVVLEDEPR